MVRNLILLLVSLREVYVSSFQKIPQVCSVIEGSKAITQNRSSCWSQGHPAHDPLLGFAFFILWLHRTLLNLRLWFLTGAIFLSSSCCLACSKLQIQLVSGFSKLSAYFHFCLWQTDRHACLLFEHKNFKISSFSCFIYHYKLPGEATFKNESTILSWLEVSE